MKRNFTITIYYKNGYIDKIYPICVKEGESYYETIQEQRVHNISLS